MAVFCRPLQITSLPKKNSQSSLRRSLHSLSSQFPRFQEPCTSNCLLFHWVSSPFCPTWKLRPNRNLLIWRFVDRWLKRLEYFRALYPCEQLLWSGKRSLRRGHQWRGIWECLEGEITWGEGPEEILWKRTRWPWRSAGVWIKLGTVYRPHIRSISIWRLE